MKGKILILLFIIAISIIPMVATAQLAESDHPYANNFAYTWPAITEPGATQMRLHFTKIELANCDVLKILNGDGIELVRYGSCSSSTLLKEDVWTEWFTVDTMKVRLETSEKGNAYGFLLDQKETRQTLIPTTTYISESYHPYPNNFAYTWPVITEPGTSQMRLHFIKIELANCDVLKILNGDGIELVRYGSCSSSTLLKEDVWTEWFTIDTMKVRLETSEKGNEYGFLLDQKEIRAGTPTPTPISTIAPTPIAAPTFTPTPTKTLTPPSTNTPTYTTAPISTPRPTPTKTLTPPSTNTPTYTTAPISTPRLTPTQTLTPPPMYLLETTPTNIHPTETFEQSDWRSILVIIVLAGLVGIIFKYNNNNWQNNVWVYIVVTVIGGIIAAIIIKICL